MNPPATRPARVWHDISPLLSPRIATFPGDTPFQRDVVLDFSTGNLEVSAICASVHVGAHADAPSHYRNGGATIDQRSLDLYFGACQVLSVSLPQRERITAAHVEGRRIQAPRVLFKTSSYPDADAWTDGFNALSPSLIEHLVAAGVRLVGIDTPSIDIADDKILESHQSVAKHDLAVLEGLVLSGVPEGLYTLMALPLKLASADASPVRAVLLGDGGRAGGDAFESSGAGAR